MRLEADRIGCAGNSGSAHDDFRLCPLRDRCARYTDYFALHLTAHQPLPRMYALNPCTLYIEDQTEDDSPDQ